MAADSAWTYRPSIMRPSHNDPATGMEFSRRGREFRTIAAMLRMYCRAHHDGAQLCAECSALHDYAQRRLDRCVFGEAKPTCAHCTVHCYSAGMRERIRLVMRWAGPRMLWRHPLLAIRHLIDGRRRTPSLPQRG